MSRGWKLVGRHEREETPPRAGFTHGGAGGRPAHNVQSLHGVVAVVNHLFILLVQYSLSPKQLPTTV